MAVDVQETEDVGSGIGEGSKVEVAISNRRADQVVFGPGEGSMFDRNVHSRRQALAADARWLR